jgi:RNA polymerase sigma-70 factor (ECF subfamily)
VPDNDLSDKWRDWFQENGTRLLLFARGKTNSEQDAKDVLQESIYRLWKSYSSKEDGTFNPPPLPLAFTAVRNTAIDFARKTGRRIKREQKSDQIAYNNDEVAAWFEADNLIEKERAQDIENALKRISSKYREVITLKIWGELTFLEIAEALDIPSNTAASRYRYGLDALRKILKPNIY